MPDRPSQPLRPYRPIVALTVFLATPAAAQDDASPVAPPSAAASAPAARDISEEARAVASSALGACFRRAPAYPRAAVRAEQEGTTVVSFEVSAAGVAERPVLSRSSRFPLLDEAALNHMKRCLEATAAQTQGTLPPGRYALPLVWRLE